MAENSPQAELKRLKTTYRKKINPVEFFRTAFGVDIVIVCSFGVQK